MKKTGKRRRKSSHKPGNTGGCKMRGCRAWAMKGSEYCFAHDPVRSRDRESARRQGGKTSTAPKVLHENFPLQTIPEVKDMLERVTNATLNGEIDLGRARTAGYLASLILSCLKDYDLEKRMEAIEAKLELQK
jgi:hypothetical protein